MNLYRAVNNVRLSYISRQCYCMQI